MKVDREKFIVMSRVYRQEMRSGFSTLSFTDVPNSLTKVRMQKTSLNQMRTPRRPCSASGGAYTALSTESCSSRDPQ
ncbi:hypothetical protein ANCDUO_24389 [Ancylostoma duodenale]|uniref:Uncharacterized protein n=1 Tax=Ancylostoma duodenale TaxID=51022 RepID=A0A0C2FFX7_9BILA|nr:hypothetical protein ANCDUO_24389 [Ancylostoma duodenale]